MRSGEGYLGLEHDEVHVKEKRRPWDCDAWVPVVRIQNVAMQEE